MQEGWFLAYSHLLKEGKIPYKDFYFFLQPTYLFLATALTSAFGETLVTLRIFGLIEKLVLVAVTYLLLRRLVSRGPAILASTTAVVFYTGTSTDVIYSYYQSCLLFSVLSLYAVIVYTDNDLKDTRGFPILFVAGVFGGLAFSIKQTTGLLVPSAVFLVLVLYELKYGRTVVKSALAYGCGFLLPVSVLMAWLLRVGAFEAYINEVFVSAASSKGSLLAILCRSVLRQLKEQWTSVILALFAAWLLLRRGKEPNDDNFRLRNPTRHVLLLFLFSLASLAVSYVIKDQFGLLDAVRFALLKRGILTFVFFFSLASAVVYGWRVFIRTGGKRDLYCLFVSLACVAIIYGHGLSWNVEEHAMVPALGFFVTALIHKEFPWNRFKNSMVYAICFAIISFTAVQRYIWPYDWWGWREPPVREAELASTLPALRGLWMSPETNRVFTEVTRLMQENSLPSDTVYVFPHMALFYFLSERYPGTFSLVHYFDVCSDKCAMRDARTLMATPPKVIVIEHFPVPVWEFHEMAFRKGKASAQRQIVYAINTLIKDYPYFLAGTYDSPSDEPEYRIDVLVRKTGSPESKLPTELPLPGTISLTSLQRNKNWPTKEGQYR